MEQVNNAVKALSTNSASKEQHALIYDALSTSKITNALHKVWVQKACKEFGMDYRKLYDEIQDQKKKGGK
ncbi:hypothetical protein D3C80_1770810 [compost metagenome]